MFADDFTLLAQLQIIFIAIFPLIIQSPEKKPCENNNNKKIK